MLSLKTTVNRRYPWGLRLVRPNENHREETICRRGGKADAEDLKSSGGEPPCGFDSHRRYSRQIADQLDIVYDWADGHNHDRPRGDPPAMALTSSTMMELGTKAPDFRLTDTEG